MQNFRARRTHQRLPIPDFEALKLDTNITVEPISDPSSSSSYLSPFSPLSESSMPAKRLTRTIRRGWANWQIKDTKHQNTMQYTIRMADRVMYYSNVTSPSEQFAEAMKYMTDIQSMRDTAPEESAEMIANTLEDDMILVIFGSNLIERAGLNLDHTKRLCQAIFRGEHYEMTERSGPYEQRLQGWLQDKHASGEGEKHQIRQRAEVVQHALALRYIVDAIVTRDQPFSEDILKETHRILITGVDHPKYDTPWQEYAGLYRNQVRQPGTGQMGAEVNAGSTHFTASKMVPRAMKRIVDALNDDIAAATEKGVLDPYPLAAKWCAEFVWCHPFLDGNGRLCRLLLNAILLKYAGIVVPIGEHDEERQEYLDIKRRYTTDCEGEGEFASMIMKRATLRLKTMRDRVRKGLDTKASERLLKP